MANNDLKRGLSSFHSGNYKAAIAILSKVFEEEDDVESGYHLALSYSQINDHNNALKVFDKVVGRLDNKLRQMQAHIIIGYIYTVREMYDLAELELKEAMSSGVSNAQIHSALGFVYFKQNKGSLAIEELKKAVELQPDNANARNSLGFVMLELGGNIDEAIKEIEYAVDLDKDNPVYLDSLGVAFYKKNDFDKAKRILTRAFELAPDNKQIREHLNEVINSKKK